jgi:hypothetical protein
MGTRLVTIAAFDQPAKARLAQNALQAAGIRAAVSDETVVAMDWLLSNAVGGVKVQVWEEDAERAVAELEQAFGPHGEGFGTVDPEQLAAEAVAARPEGNEEPAPEDFASPAPATTATLGDEDAGETLTERERYARRAYFASLFGLAVPVLLFYAVYLVLMAWSAEGDLRGRWRGRAVLAAAITAIGLAAWWSWTLVYPSDFFDIF